MYTGPTTRLWEVEEANGYVIIETTAIPGNTQFLLSHITKRNRVKSCNFVCNFFLCCNEMCESSCFFHFSIAIAPLVRIYYEVMKTRYVCFTCGCGIHWARWWRNLGSNTPGMGYRRAWRVCVYDAPILPPDEQQRDKKEYVGVVSLFIVLGFELASYVGKSLGGSNSMHLGI